jgi:hypothetical protein
VCICSLSTLKFAETIFINLTRMEDQTAAATEPSVVSSNVDDQRSETIVDAPDPQPSTEPITIAPEKPEVDLVQPTENNVINQVPEADVNTNDKIEQVDQTLDRDQDQKNSAVIVENSEKNDDTSSTTSDDSDDESSSSSMHLGIENKKSKINDLDEDEDPADNKPIRSTNELKVIIYSFSHA